MKQKIFDKASGITIHIESQVYSQLKKAHWPDKGFGHVANNEEMLHEYVLRSPLPSQRNSLLRKPVSSETPQILSSVKEIALVRFHGKLML